MLLGTPSRVSIRGLHGAQESLVGTVFANPQPSQRCSSKARQNCGSVAPMGRLRPCTSYKCSVLCAMKITLPITNELQAMEHRCSVSSQGSLSVFSLVFQALSFSQIAEKAETEFRLCSSLHGMRSTKVRGQGKVK